MSWAFAFNPPDTNTISWLCSAGQHCEFPASDHLFYELLIKLKIRCSWRCAVLQHFLSCMGTISEQTLTLSPRGWSLSAELSSLMSLCQSCVREREKHTGWADDHQVTFRNKNSPSSWWRKRKVNWWPVSSWSGWMFFGWQTTDIEVWHLSVKFWLIFFFFILSFKAGWYPTPVACVI